MEPTFLAASLLFGSFGLAFFIYGKRQRLPVPWILGIVLMACPYFVTGTLLLTITGAALVASAYFFRFHGS